MGDTIKLPLDADGVPIRPGDAVYKNGEPNQLLVRSLQYTGYQLGPWSINIAGEDKVSYIPQCFSHTNPDFLEIIEKAINELIKEATLDYLAKVETKEKVAPLMERIKRMVEQ